MLCPQCNKQAAESWLTPWYVYSIAKFLQ
jgi:hypothetical protein